MRVAEYEGQFIATVDAATGALDSGANAFTKFGGTGGELSNTVELAVDATGAVFFAVSGSGNSAFNGSGPLLAGSGTFWVGKLKSAASGGGADLSLNTRGYLPIAANMDQHTDSPLLALGSASRVYVAGRNFQSVDLDPYSGVTTASARGGFLISINPTTPLTPIDRTHPLTFIDSNGEQVSATLAGNGYGEYTLQNGGSNNSDFDTITLFDTDDTTQFVIKMVDPAAIGTTIHTIITNGAKQHVGSIELGSRVVLGSGQSDATNDMFVSGHVNKLTLDDVRENTRILIGSALTPAEASAFRATVTIGDVLGANVSLRFTDSDDAPNSPGGDKGGGGLVLNAGSWPFPGLIAANQTSDIVIADGDLGATVEIDRYATSIGAAQNLTLLKVTNGIITASDNVVRGHVVALDAFGFTETATLDAASLGSLTIRESPAISNSGNFDGTLRLSNATPILVFTLNPIKIAGDFTGVISSAAPIAKVTLGGDFKGTLRGKSIGAIAAKSFDGNTNDEGAVQFGNPLHKNIIATDGGIGLLKPTEGGVVAYDIHAPKGDFGGIFVNATKPLTAGIDDVSTIARSITILDVTLKQGTGGTVFGIRSSSFKTTGFGGTAKDDGFIGIVSVELKNVTNATGATGLDNVLLDAWVQPNEFAADLGAHPASTINAVAGVNVFISGIPGTLNGLRNSAVEGDFISKHVSISLTATSTDSGAKVVGINSSTFAAHADGADPKNAAQIAGVFVTLKGGPGANDYLGIFNSTFTADVPSGFGFLGDISVRLNNVGGTAGGIDTSTFTADEMRQVYVDVDGASDLVIGYGIDESNFHATGPVASGKEAGAITRVFAGVSGVFDTRELYGITRSVFSSATSTVGPVIASLFARGDVLQKAFGISDTDITAGSGAYLVSASISGGGPTLDAHGITSTHITGAAHEGISARVTVTSEDFGTVTGIGDDVSIVATNGGVAKIASTVKAIEPGGTTGTLFGIAANTGAVVATGTFIGSMSVTASGGPDLTQAVAHTGANRTVFTATQFGLGSFKAVTTASKSPGAVANGVEGLTLRSLSANVGKISLLGSVTGHLADDLLVSAAAGFSGLLAKSADQTKGSVLNSVFLAGQALDPTGTAKLQKAQYAAAKLGTISVSGNLVASQIIGAADVSAVTVGTKATGNLSNSIILAGVKLGSDALLGGTDGAADTFYHWGTISAITVRGTLARTTIAAGVDPGDAIFGNAGDTAAITTTPELSKLIGKITAIAGGATSVLNPATPFSTPVALAHDWVIEAPTLGKITIGKAKPAVTFPLYLDAATGGMTGAEDASDILVRKVV